MNQSIEGQNHDNDEIDILKLIEFVFSIKKIILLSVAVSILLGFIFYFLEKVHYKTLYHTRISVRIDELTVQTSFEQEDLIREFDDVFSSPVYANLIYNKIFNDKSNLNSFSKYYSEIDFVNNMLAGGQNRPIEIEKSNSRSDYFLKIQLPFKGINQESIQTFVQMLNEVANERNKRALKLVTFNESIPLRVTNEVQGQSLDRLDIEKLAAGLELELAEAETNLGRIHYNIVQIAQQNGINTNLLNQIGPSNQFSPTIMMSAEDVKKNINGPIQGTIEVVKSANGSRQIFRILGALLQNKVISEKTCAEFQKNIIDIEQKIMRLRAEANQNRFNLLSRSLGSAASGLKFLPNFTENKGYNEAITKEKMVTFNLLPKVLGASLILGLGIGLILGFARRVYAKLKANLNLRTN